MHDCDATRGSSGSSFFNGNNQYTVIALNFGEFRNGDNSQKFDEFNENYSNLMITTDNFYEYFVEASNWEPRPPYHPHYDNEDEDLEEEFEEEKSEEEIISNSQKNIIMHFTYFIILINLI